jgi:hypothetical protein
MVLAVGRTGSVRDHHADPCHTMPIMVALAGHSKLFVTGDTEGCRRVMADAGTFVSTMCPPERWRDATKRGGSPLGCCIAHLSLECRWSLNMAEGPSHRDRRRVLQFGRAVCPP